MKPYVFEYIRATKLEEAISLLANAGEHGKLISGGQSLVPALNLRLLAPQTIIDIAHLNELKGITCDSTHIHIGASTRHVELTTSSLIAEKLPLLKVAASHVAHAAIRNRGTLGGNLAHADPASELPACMIALEAVMVVMGLNGQRSINAEDFFTGVYETALQVDEILVRVSIRHQPAKGLFYFNEFVRRAGDYAMAGLAIVMHVDESRKTKIRPVFFGVGERPILARHAAICLEDATTILDGLTVALSALHRDIQPQEDLQVDADTRMQFAKILLKRGVADLQSHARNEWSSKQSH